MTTDASENTSHKGQPYRAFRIAHAGKQGSFIGRYATAIEAAVAVARDVRDRGLSRRSLVAALSRGLKGEALLMALEDAKSRKEAKTKGRSGGGGGDGEDDDDDEEDAEGTARGAEEPPAAEAPIPNGGAPPAPPPPAAVGSAGVRAALVRLNLEQYADMFDELGYDDLPYLIQMGVEARGQVATEVGLKPGHARKFVELLGEA